MAGNINPNPFTTRPEIDGTFGVVASTHWIAAAVFDRGRPFCYKVIQSNNGSALAS
jgi:hypothetical protein